MSRINTGKAKNQSRKLRSKWTNTKKGIKKSETGAKIHHFGVETRCGDILRHGIGKFVLDMS